MKTWLLTFRATPGRGAAILTTYIMAATKEVAADFGRRHVDLAEWSLVLRDVKEVEGKVINHVIPHVL